MNTAATSETSAAKVRDRAPVIAFAWGLAEALVFFIVPDVYLTRVALRSWQRAAICCVAALFGTLIGGTLLWYAGSHGYAPRLLHSFVWLPGITHRVITDTAQAIHGDGLLAVFSGAFSGRPYKLYAVHAGAQAVPLAAFLTISLTARLGRFLLTASLAWLAGRTLQTAAYQTRLRVHALFWATFYIIYFLILR